MPEVGIRNWDLAKSTTGEPSKEILESDMFVNSIYLSKQFLNFADVKSSGVPDRMLSVSLHRRR